MPWEINLWCFVVFVFVFKQIWWGKKGGDWRQFCNSGCLLCKNGDQVWIPRIQIESTCCNTRICNPRTPIWRKRETKESLEASMPANLVLEKRKQGLLSNQVDGTNRGPRLFFKFYLWYRLCKHIFYMHDCTHIFTHTL